MTVVLPSDAEKAFKLKLKKAFQSLVKDAQQRTCGECIHACFTSAGLGHCLKYENCDGGSLKLHRTTAYACRDGFAPTETPAAL